MDAAIRWQDHREGRKDVMLDEPTMRGTRLTVEQILGEMGAGMGEGELPENDPPLRPEHVRAGLMEAAAVVAMDPTSFA